MREQREPVVIVGGGLSGLATLSLLRRAGRTARLFEASRELGGRSRVTRQGEAVVGLGGHALYKGAADALFRELGIALRGREVRHRNARGLLEDRDVDLPLSPWSLLTSSDFPWGDKFKAGSVLASKKLSSKVDPKQTIGAWLDESGLPPLARGFVTALLRVTNYSSLDELSAEVAMEQLTLGSKGVRYLDGGFAQLVEKLAAHAREAGGRIDLGCAVRAVEIEGGRAAGVRLASGEVIRASQVVLCVSPKQLAQLVPSSREAQDHQERAIAMRAACLDLVLDGPAPRSTLALGMSEPYYFAVHSEAAKMCPDGQTVLHTARYLAPDEQRPAEEVRTELERMVERVAPGTMQRVIAAQYLPSIAVSEWLPTAASGGYAGRPGILVDVPGIYRAGDWVGPQGMLADAAAASAQAVSLVLQRERVEERAA